MILFCRVRKRGQTFFGTKNERCEFYEVDEKENVLLADGS